MRFTDIERLKATKDFLREQHQENLKKCKFPELKPLIIETYHENIMAFNVAISALEKQIPKRPIFLRYSTNITFACVCNARIKKGDKYCRVCGQALDWSDTERPIN